MAMVISDLYIYPVKGLQGIKVSSGTLTERGFELDRRWMLTDKNGKFISQREYPLLASYATKIGENDEVLISKDDCNLNMSIADVSDKIKTVSMWDKNFDVHIASDRICEWWTQQLGRDTLAVYMKDEDIRIKEYKGQGDRTELSMADGYPYLILGTASLKELNRKLLSPISIDRFRANIIVDTDIAHIEDTWKYIQVGNQKLYVVKPCARCQVISIDQKNGMKHKEPIPTLATYRKRDNKVNFGVNTISLTKGKIKVGDKLTLINKST